MLASLCSHSSVSSVLGSTSCCPASRKEHGWPLPSARASSGTRGGTAPPEDNVLSLDTSRAAVSRFASGVTSHTMAATFRVCIPVTLLTQVKSTPSISRLLASRLGQSLEFLSLRHHLLTSSGYCQPTPQMLLLYLNISNIFNL